MAAASSQGPKQTMEDCNCLAVLHPQHGVLSSLPSQGVCISQQHVAVAAVFDGHAGCQTAATAAEHLPHLLHQGLSGRQGSSTVCEDGPSMYVQEPLHPRCALTASMRSFDSWWFARRGRDRSGSTAVVGLVQGQELTVGNLGDSVALLARGGSCQRLTVDHRADNAAEMLRVLAAGGELEYDGCGTLRLYRPTDAERRNGCMFTRSLGDFAFKQPAPLLCCEPHVAHQTLLPGDSLLLLASDGVSDWLPDDDAMAVALRALEQARNRTDDAQQLAQAAADGVMAAALHGNSGDNITAAVMLLDWS
uniref:protein-serine/threonine phosphatase n=1 Tax=Tetradesmus obliquus TaxID=3088 RepID=A0A383W3M2_TETOB|eukprot:jgi/Sobl393_1/479/SZX71266.1